MLTGDFNQCPTCNVITSYFSGSQVLKLIKNNNIGKEKQHKRNRKKRGEGGKQGLKEKAMVKHVEKHINSVSSIP